VPKSVLESGAASGVSALGVVLAAAPALVRARVRLPPRVCADGPLAFWAEDDALPPALADGPPLPGVLPAGGEPPVLLELPSLGGLAVLVVYFRNRGSIAVEDVNLMKG